MAYFGAQSQAADRAAWRRRCATSRAVRRRRGPAHWDRSRYTDEAGCETVSAPAYWDDPARYDAWFAAQGRDWTRVARPGLGTFTEVLRPHVERYETLFSAPDRAEGIAVLADAMSDVVMEHAYWGGARDRIPASQTDAMAPLGEPSWCATARSSRCAATRISA
jgi:aldoxime dehydratase